MAEFTPRRADYVEAVRALSDSVGFHRTANLTLGTVEPGRVTASMRKSEGLTQQDGYFHAGVLTALADAVGGLAAYSLMAEGQRVLSVNLSVSLLRPAESELVEAEGKVIKAGRRIYVTEAKLYDGSKGAGRELLAMATVTLAVV